MKSPEVQPQWMCGGEGASLILHQRRKSEQAAQSKLWEQGVHTLL